MKYIAQLMILAFAVVADIPEAHAYIDPGTGSLMLQGILALIGGTAVTIKLYWGKIRSLFIRDSSLSADTPDEHR